jgi:hypothetical protein
MHLLRGSTKTLVKLEEEVLPIGKRTKTTQKIETFNYIWRRMHVVHELCKRIRTSQKYANLADKHATTDLHDILKINSVVCA